MTPETASPPDSAATACPHVVFSNVFGQRAVTDLLDYVAARQADFKPSIVRSRKSGERRVDYGLRSCVSLGDLGRFKAPFESYVREIAPSALAQLNLTEPGAEPKDFEFAAYRDGNRFAAHIDTSEMLHKVRVLSCVYYFAVTPRRFSGGELRLYGMPTPSAAKNRRALFVDVAPETDMMVVFPSWLRHEVLPVSVPSGEWRDSRFTMNCWLHRAAPSAQASAS